MLRHALAFLAALALAFSPLAVNAAQADCDMAGMDMGAMMRWAWPAAATTSDTAQDPCCDHGKAMSAKDCARACATSCALAVAVPGEGAVDHSPITYRVETRWSNTSGQAHDPAQEDPPPRSLI
jgi:hypothetical protein